MIQPRVSVVVVSRNRPEALRMCLLALKFQFYENFEIVVVADRAGLAVAQRLGFIDPTKAVLCEVANISIARNLGIGAAGGDIVAFIDDDGIAEPTWLEFLIAPFVDSRVAAAGGFVRGRNGISFQWKAEALQADGTPVDLDVADSMIFDPKTSQAIKTQGTNCAFRRSLLMVLGGFDPAFAFFLDETDLNWRIWQAGYSTAIVPDAQVQHRYLGNDQRTGDRVIKSLRHIGQSVGYFQRKHGLPESFLSYHREMQRRRCLTQMRDGQLEPRDVAVLLNEYDQAVGTADTTETGKEDFPGDAPTFTRIARSDVPTTSDHLICWMSGQKEAFERAKASSDAGLPATVFSFSKTALFHKCWFHPDGFWVQSGGLFGKAERTSTVFRTYRKRERYEKEVGRLERFRRFVPIPDQ